jgi:hypothetical protein
VRRDRLAHIDPLGIAALQFQNIRIDQPIMEDHVCFLQVFDGAQCQQIARARPGPDQRDMAALGLLRGAAAGDRGLDVACDGAFLAAGPGGARGRP